MSTPTGKYYFASNLEECLTYAKTYENTFSIGISCFSYGGVILLGEILNTDAQYLGAELSELGIDVYHQVVVGDNAKRLKEAGFDLPDDIYTVSKAEEEILRLFKS